MLKRNYEKIKSIKCYDLLFSYAVVFIASAIIVAIGALADSFVSIFLGAMLVAITVACSIRLLCLPKYAVEANEKGVIIHKFFSTVDVPFASIEKAICHTPTGKPFPFVHEVLKLKLNNGKTIRVMVDLTEAWDSVRLINNCLKGVKKLSKTHK